jgi:hypothetical protein
VQKRLSQSLCLLAFWRTDAKGFLEHRKVLPQNACYTPAQALPLGQYAVASGIIVLSALGLRLRELDAVDLCISEPSKRGRSIAQQHGAAVLT